MKSKKMVIYLNDPGESIFEVSADYNPEVNCYTEADVSYVGIMASVPNSEGGRSNVCVYTFPANMIKAIDHVNYMGEVDLKVRGLKHENSE